MYVLRFILTIATFYIGITFAEVNVQPNDKSIIEKIETSGNIRTETSTIISYVGFNVGDTYNKAKVDEAIKNLYATEFFSEIKISFNNHILRVTVEENPLINQIHVEGQDDVSSEVLLSEISLKPRSFFSKAKLQRDVHRLLEVYGKRGMFAVTVKPKVEKLPQNRVNILFEIKESKKAKIQQILFVGNTHFPDNALKSILTSKEDKIYNILRLNHYDPDVVEYDKMLLTRFYNDHGYANFKVISAVANVVPSANAFYLTFSMEEGHMFNFGKVKVKNNISSIDTKSIENLISFKEGALFSTRLVENSTNAIIRHMANKGFPFVKVTADYDINDAARVANVTYNISKSAKIYIGKIKVSGNLKTYDYVIRRQLKIAEGDPYNAFLVNRSEQRVRNLDFFGKVKFDIEKTSKPDVVDLNISIEEKSTASFNINVGFSTADGLGGTIKFVESNFLGKGQMLSIAFHRAVSSFNAGFEFMEPNFMNSSVDAGFKLGVETEDNTKSAFSKRDNTIPYNTKKYGGSLFMTYEITDFLSHYVDYSLSTTNLTGVDKDASAIIKAQTGKNVVSKIAHRLVYDQLDSRVKPTSGYMLALDQSLAGLGGNARFLSNVLDAKYFYPLTEDIIFKIKGETGYIHGFGKTIRLENNFFLGDHSFRGFEWAGIGPREKGGKKPAALGGKFYYKGTTEVAFPIPGVPKDLDISASVFSDFGSLMNIDIPKSINYSSNDYYNSKKIRASVGVGLTWITHIGPLRLDIARAVRKESFDKTEVIHFSMATYL